MEIFHFALAAANPSREDRGVAYDWWRHGSGLSWVRRISASSQLVLILADILPGETPPVHFRERIKRPFYFPGRGAITHISSTLRQYRALRAFIHHLHMTASLWRGECPPERLRENIPNPETYLCTSNSQIWERGCQSRKDGNWSFVMKHTWALGNFIS